MKVRPIALRITSFRLAPHGESPAPPYRYNSGVPKSKSKRNRYIPPPKPKPKPSPTWVPVLFFTFLGAGFVSILSRYLFSGTISFLDTDWFLWGGLLLIAGAFGLATQWR